MAGGGADKQRWRKFVKALGSLPPGPARTLPDLEKIEDCYRAKYAFCRQFTAAVRRARPLLYHPDHEKREWVRARLRRKFGVPEADFDAYRQSAARNPSEWAIELVARELNLTSERVRRGLL
jgi:hypothetical protein